MATQKNHSKTTKTKTVATSTTTTKPKTNKPDRKPDHKPDHKPATKSATTTSSSHAPTHKDNKFIAIVITVLSIIAVVTAVTIIAVSCTNNASLVVENGKGDKITTAYRGFNDNQFRIKIPVDFTELDQKAITEKYGNEAPNYVYADTNNDVNITVKLTDNNLGNDQIEEYLNTVKTIFNASGNVITTDYYKVDDYNVATIQLTSESTIGNFYNHMMFFSQNDKLIIVSFNCPADQRDNWQKVGEFIIKSLNFQK